MPGCGVSRGAAGWRVPSNRGTAMKLLAPSAAPSLDLVDIYGKPIAIGRGRRTLLSFFRDAACPFCNFRVYELTHHHQSLSALGLDVVAVFGSSQAEVLRFVARHPRPIRWEVRTRATASNDRCGASSRRSRPACRPWSAACASSVWPA